VKPLTKFDHGYIEESVTYIALTVRTESQL